MITTVILFCSIDIMLGFHSLHLRKFATVLFVNLKPADLTQVVLTRALQGTSGNIIM